MRSIFAESADPAGEGPSWVDLAFDIAEARTDARSGRLAIVAHAATADGTAGFGVEYDRVGWCRDQVSSDIWFDFGTASLFSLGAESDRFATLLSQLMGDGDSRRFVARADCDAVLINSDPERMMEQYCSSKLFIGPEDDEAQVFINFDIPAGLCEFREKDPWFRVNLLRLLAVH